MHIDMSHRLIDEYYESENSKDIRYTYTEKQDSIVEKVIGAYRERSEKGIKEYGKTLDRKDFSFLRWLNELQTELMDATLYIEKLKEEYGT